MPGWDEEAADDPEWGASPAEPIYWYEFPTEVLRKICRQRSLLSRGSDDLRN
jgi:hypothetical protein